MRLQDLAVPIRTRRIALGLSQNQLANLTGLPQPTMHELEQGKLQDLGFAQLNCVLDTLGLTLAMPSTRQSNGGLWMAAKSASVCYRGELTPEMLANTLITAQIPPGFKPHLSYFCDETPITLIIRAVEETSHKFGIEPHTLWHHVARLSQDLASPRAHLWS